MRFIASSSTDSGVAWVVSTIGTPESVLEDAINRIERLDAVIERPRLLRIARI